MVLKDKRLLACAEEVTGDFVCDIGTDHGYLPAYLLSSGKCTRAIAADINEKPLEAARTTLEREGLADKAELCLSDGLKSVSLEGVTDIVIAGMGGELISRIIAADERVRSEGITFILQPMTRAGELRRFLAENGFDTINEKGVCDGRFAYCVITCRYSGRCRSISSVEEVIGKLSPERSEDREYISRQTARLENAAEGMKMQSPERSAELMKTVEEIRAAIRAD